MTTYICGSAVNFQITKNYTLIDGKRIHFWKPDFFKILSIKRDENIDQEKNCIQYFLQ